MGIESCVLGVVRGYILGMFQHPLTLILLQRHRDTNGTRMVIQIGGVYTTFCQEQGVLLQKYCYRNSRSIATIFKSIGVRGRFDSPEKGSSISGVTKLQRVDNSEKLFPAVLVWQKTAMIADIPGPQNRNEGTILGD